MLVLGLGSGMRIGEISGLVIGDVSDGRRVLAEIRLDRWSTKSKRSRTVTLTRQVQLALKAWLLVRGSEDRNAPLFPSGRRPWAPLTTEGAQRAVRNAFLAAGIVGASSHSLRRTHAKELRRRGIDLKIIQEQLGHSSLAITERYLQIDPVEKRAAIEGLKFQGHPHDFSSVRVAMDYPSASLALETRSDDRF